ncbi:hypothetical protein DCC35_03405 [Mangrovivirga cuniculi]|uniref:Sialidase domain-containing protein n=1 Tax=Mangrovivirga cuniculi TaxID=2715131 RepID=A0A4D7JFH7_9BACT|nr:hypothetical protein DCC35_03405 [Mangrovivirga cuniculi]
MTTLDKDGNWSKPTNNFSKWNNKENNVLAGIKDDQKIVYLNDSYRSSGGIAFSKFNGKNWSNPESIKIPGISESSYTGYYMTPDYQVLIISMKGSDSYGEEDIYISLKDSATGQWSVPKNLGPTINTKGFEISPFLSDDMETLYFASNGHGGYGDSDIFMSKRLFGSWTVWTKPVNLGPNINSEKFDGYLNISKQSKKAFLPAIEMVVWLTFIGVLFSKSHLILI